ncbi:MAG: glycosyltransferase family protein [Candidatus Riflebacteria bacterium]|nr:glycosyltransferase family protein [Candidatus Riflebacteria bacterium]
MNSNSEKKLKINAVIQARMGSTRLPGKAMKDLLGKPMLERVIDRVKMAGFVNDVIVACTVCDEDMAIVDFCKKKGVNFFRGSEEDVLDRYFQTLMKFPCDAIVRITSDCPLIDPEVIDQGIKEFLAGQPDLEYVSNAFLVNSFPRGLDIEVIKSETLAKLWEIDTNPLWREHVTLFIEKHPESFKTKNIAHSTDLSKERWTVDTTEDFKLVQKIFQHFGETHFSWKNVLEILDQNPNWREINKTIKQKKID